MAKKTPTAGIYMIRNASDGRVYVGQSFDLEKREKQHFRALRRGDHKNLRLQRAFLRDGEVSLLFSVLEYCPVEQLTEREQHWIDAHSYVYNICPAGGSSLGVKRSDETRKKCSDAKKGKKPPHLFTDEVRSKAHATYKARWHEIHGTDGQSAETIAKRSASQKERWAKTPKKPFSEESRKKMSESAKNRKPRIKPEELSNG
jgi:group I intron endonuclease